MKQFRITLGILAGLAMAGCATMPPDPTVLDNARSAITRADDAGASEYAPLELRFARERLEQAEAALEDGNGDRIRRLADEAEIEAQLALARTQAALTRADLAQRQRDLDELKADLIEAFGEEMVDP